MTYLKVTAVAINQTPMDWHGNWMRIQEAFEDAVDARSSILCFPELSIPGYGCEDHFHSTDLQHRSLAILDEICNLTTSADCTMVVCVGLPLMFRNALYNVIAVIQGGEVLGFVAKQHLAGDGIHYESRWFRAWPTGCQETVTYQGNEVPIGDLRFNFKGVRVGFEICEDAWVAERPGGRLARQGVDIILNPSASHFAFGKHKIRERFVVEGSRAFSCTYVYSNLLGNEAGRAIYDGGCLIATGGNVVAAGPRFSMEDYLLVSATVDLSATRTQQARTASFEPSFEPMTWVESKEAVSDYRIVKDPSEPIQIEHDNKFYEFREASALALFDYMRKSHSKGFVISLSGGADSAACAMMVGLMVTKGVAELGKEAFCSRLGRPELGQVDSIVQHVLSCLYQGTSNSSETTRNAAESVANGVGASFAAIDVQPMVDNYVSAIGAISRVLNWEHDDLALQNIQARVRAPSVWLIANMQHKLLITTSNRSEAAVGYCTMDGDTAGSISPIAGVSKSFILAWLKHLETTFPFITAVTCQKPTAELRPGESQTDEEDLMPYEILEYIEDLAILEKKSPFEVFERLARRNGKKALPQALARDYVVKFFRLWCRNQWKREKISVSWNLDNHNLDPRSWCRFPVLSSGFSEELEHLEGLRLS